MLNMPIVLLVPSTDKESAQPAVEWADIASITLDETYGASTRQSARICGRPLRSRYNFGASLLYARHYHFHRTALLALEFLKR
jgi:hypothetical protein